MKEIFFIFGQRSDYHLDRTRIASFDSSEIAETYIEKSKLKSVREAEKSGALMVGRKFKKNTLCGPFLDCWVERGPGIPHNPQV